jgi:hypothetical protein
VSLLNGHLGLCASVYCLLLESMADTEPTVASEPAAETAPVVVDNTKKDQPVKRRKSEVDVDPALAASDSKPKRERKTVEVYNVEERKHVEAPVKQVLARQLVFWII